MCGGYNGPLVFEQSVEIEADHFLTEPAINVFYCSFKGNISLMAKTRPAFSTSPRDPVPSGIAPIICGEMP